MNPPLRYLPAYLGLFFAQVLALACNAFLDIRYGAFAIEVLLWAAAFAFTLRVGWRQRGEITEFGTRWMRRTAMFGMLLAVVVFLPMWGLPRAGIYFLAMLMASYNCVTTSRRHLNLSLLISVVMVLYAATHYRADWTMLFYLVPYVAAVVFTLVAEQINRTAGELRRQSLGHPVGGAQGTAIAAATTVILALGLLLYALTPQVTWMSMSWRWGQPSSSGLANGNNQAGAGGSGSGQAGGSGGSARSGEGRGSMRPDWPSPGEMREAAARRGMPAWQRNAINGLANLTERVQSAMRPIMARMERLRDALWKWIEKNRDRMVRMLSALGMLAMLYTLFRLAREARVATWLRTRFDYVRLVLLGMHGTDARSARTIYEAMVRLFSLQNIERDAHENTREYLTEIGSYYRHLRSETGELTRHYEDARYGGRTSAAQVARMRDLYRRVFQGIA